MKEENFSINCIQESLESQKKFHSTKDFLEHDFCVIQLFKTF